MVRVFSPLPSIGHGNQSTLQGCARSEMSSLGPRGRWWSCRRGGMIAWSLTHLLEDDAGATICTHGTPIFIECVLLTPPVWVGVTHKHVEGL